MMEGPSLTSREVARKASRELIKQQNDTTGGGKRDRLKEHLATKFILQTLHIQKPDDIDYPEWLHDGNILMQLMNTLSFNAIPNDPYSHIGCNPEIDRVRSLIETLENYGVKKKFLFQLDDLYKMRNIPKVTRCIEEIEKLAMLEEHIVSDCLPSNKVYYS